MRTALIFVGMLNWGVSFLNFYLFFAYNNPSNLVWGFIAALVALWMFHDLPPKKVQ